MLVAHVDSDYEEWGAGAAVRLDPGEHGRGLSFSLSPTRGASSSAAERLWGARDARALTPHGEFEASRGYPCNRGPASRDPGHARSPDDLGAGVAWRLAWQAVNTRPGRRRKGIAARGRGKGPRRRRARPPRAGASTIGRAPWR